MLVDVCIKIFSSVMNRWAFCLLDLQGTNFQFGSQDGLLILKTLINAHKNHITEPEKVGIKLEWHSVVL